MSDNIYNLRDAYISCDRWIDSWLNCKLCGTHLLCGAHAAWLKQELMQNQIKICHNGGDRKCSEC